MINGSLKTNRKYNFKTKIFIKSKKRMEKNNFPF